MIERWRSISGFDGLYEVSDMGRVRSLDRKVKRGDQYLTVRGRVMTPSMAGKGYRKVTLCRDGKQTHRYMHALVLETFVGPAPAGMEGAHGNGRRDDNRLTNLRWDTRSGNFADKIIHGTATSGERHGRRKLCAADVRQIRRASGNQNIIAARFGISRSQVYRIKMGLNWGALS